MKITEYTMPRGGFPRALCFAIVADVHGGDPAPILRALEQVRPDYILMPGDILERLDGTDSRARQNGLALLRGAAALAPTFYSTGNHEDGATHSWNPLWKKRVRQRSYAEQDLRAIEETGAVLLCDRFVLRDGIAFGGLSSGLINPDARPRLDWLDMLERVEGPRVLLCHHPEYYEKYLARRALSLIVSGHAHGGQWRFFGRGVFAPGQGLFPRYTAGIHGQMVVSRGLKRSGTIPRIFNEPELVILHV